jgi:hypothetical protein
VERVKPTRALNGAPEQLDRAPEQLDCALARLKATRSGTNLPSQGLILRADSAIELPAETTQVSRTFILPHAKLIRPARATDEASISPHARLLEGPAILTITPRKLPTSSSTSSTSSHTLSTTSSQVPSIYFTPPVVHAARRTAGASSGRLQRAVLASIDISTANIKIRCLFSFSLGPLDFSFEYEPRQHHPNQYEQQVFKIVIRAPAVHGAF